MYIKLKWTNINSQPVTVKIYRTDTVVPKEELGEPVVVLTNGETEWTDTDVLRDRTYVYTFETIGEYQTVFSRPFEIVAAPRLGPGPNTLQYGDMSYGYFGSILGSDFMSATELRQLAGVTKGTVIEEKPIWDKWARNGKVIYFPRNANTLGISWIDLYNLGLVYGVDGPGPWNPGTPVNQLKIIQKGLDRFKVRLMTGIDDRNNPDRILPDDYATRKDELLQYSEFADFIFPLTYATPPGQRMFNIAELDRVALGFNSTSRGSTSVTQELNTERSRAMSLSTSTITTTNRDTMRSIGALLIGSDYTWWPVLELVEDAEIEVGEV